jgi:predicted amidohydrolase
MASNMVAKAQKIVWQQNLEEREECLVEAISQRCRLVVAPEEAISQTPEIRHSHSNKHGHGMSM